MGRRSVWLHVSPTIMSRLPLGDRSQPQKFSIVIFGDADSTSRQRRRGKGIGPCPCVVHKCADLSSLSRPALCQPPVSSEAMAKQRSYHEVKGMQRSQEGNSRSGDQTRSAPVGQIYAGKYPMNGTCTCVRTTFSCDVAQVAYAGELCQFCVSFPADIPCVLSGILALRCLSESPLTTQWISTVPNYNFIQPTHP